MNVIETLKALKLESSTNSKIKLLKACQERDKLIKFLDYAYNKKIKFNIKSSAIQNIRSGIYDEIPWNMFDEVHKTSGRGAKLGIIKQYLSGSTKDVITFCKNVFDKDLGIGISIKTINKAFGEDTVEDFKLQLAFKISENRYKLAFSELEWVYVNLKIDGIRCVVTVNSKDDITFTTRNGLDVQPFLVENIKQDIIKNIGIFKGRILDGEIYSRHFQKLMRIVNRKNVNMDSVKIRNSTRFSIFDLIDIGDKPLIERVETIDKLKSKTNATFINYVKYLKVSNDFKLIQEIAKKYINAGCEGIILKNPFTEYEKKRSNNWLKFKDEQEVDLRITGYFEGEVGTKYENMLGGIILNYENSELRCGSGFSDDERKSYWCERDMLIGKIAEITYMEMTQTGSLRHPVFKRFRNDKE